jgi:hypothetical protein
MSTNYGRSRKSQMLLGLLLQFSEFLLFQVPRKKKRRHKIKKKKWEKWLSSKWTGSCCWSQLLCGMKN